MAKVRFYFCDPTAGFKKPISWLIKLVDKAPASHFALDISGVVYESVWPKSQSILRIKWLNHYKIVKQYELDVDNIKASFMIEFCDTLIGKHYSPTQIFMIGLAALVKPFEKIFGKKIVNGNKYLICTEVGSRFMEQFMMLELKEETHDMISISDLYHLCNDLKSIGKLK